MSEKDGRYVTFFKDNQVIFSVLMSALSHALSGHVDFHKLPGRKLGIMLYRKGSDILASHHHLLHQERMKHKSLHDNEGLHNMGLTLSEEALLFEAALILNNIHVVIGQAKSAPKPLIDQVDLSKISLANLVSDTDSRWWNFIYLMTMNQTLRNQFEKKCGIEWWSHVCDSKESGMINERTSKILMIISLSLFICNDQVSLLTMLIMLSNLTSSFSGSTELNKIFNQLGLTVSDETLHRYITEVVTLLNEDNMKSSFVSNGFTVTSIDNVDKGSPHASLSFGNTKYGLHGTSVQALQPKPHSIKNSPQDYVMFRRQPTEEEETVQNLFPIRVYPDGHCLFRSVASRLEQCLLICPRNNAIFSPVR